MNIPKEITKEIVDEMIPVWEDLAESGWDGGEPYLGLCAHFGKKYDIQSYGFLKRTFKNDLTGLFISPYSGKEGAQKRLEILKQIRAELCK